MSATTGEDREHNQYKLPADHDAEAGLLGCLLTYSDRMDAAVEILRGDATDFDHDEYRPIYNAMLALWRTGTPFDPIIVGDKLRQMGKLNEVGGYAAITALVNNAPPPDRLEKYAQIIHSLAGRRADIKHGLYIAQEAQNCESDEAYAIIRQSVGDHLAGADDTSAEALPILCDDEAEALPALKGILGDILFDESVSYLYGPSGRWKSFVALDWAMCIATGTSWLGRPTVEGDVLYVCSEGGYGIGKRITAWKQRHGIRGRTRLRILPLPIDLTNAAQVAALPRRLEALDIQPALIVFDTLAASNTGDEKEAENANRITSAARRIIHAHPGACILIVHHTGYDTTHMRGSTAFYANADTVIRIEGGDANRRIEPGEPIKVISDKQKEAEPFHDIVLTAEFERWADEQGQFHSSLVMVPGDAVAANAKTKVEGLNPRRKAALAVVPAAGQEGISWSAWFAASGLSRGGFHNLVNDFIDAKLVDIDASGKYVRTPESSSSVSSVQFGLSSGEPAKRSSVQFSVSIDTEQLNLDEPLGEQTGHASTDGKTLRERPGHYGKSS